MGPGEEGGYPETAIKTPLVTGTVGALSGSLWALPGAMLTCQTSNWQHLYPFLWAPEPLWPHSKQARSAKN